MDAQARYMYQRNPNDQGPNLPQRPNGGNTPNGNNGGPPRNSGTSLLVRSLIIIGVVLLGWYLFQYFFSQNSSNNNQNVIEVPYSTFYQQVEAGNVKDVTFQAQDATGDFYKAIKMAASSSRTTKNETSLHLTQSLTHDSNLR